MDIIKLSSMSFGEVAETLKRLGLRKANTRLTEQNGMAEINGSGVSHVFLKNP